MVKQTLSFTVYLLFISHHAPPALSHEDVGEIPDRLREGHALKPNEALACFWESFRLQSNDGDLLSAVEGFHSLARVRRGIPWPEADAASAAAVANGLPGISEVEEHDRPVTGGGGSVGGGSDGGSSAGDSAFSVPDKLEAFLQPSKRAVIAFEPRAKENLVTTGKQDFSISSAWAPDVFDPAARGNNFVTALHKLDHDREQLEYLVAKKRLPPEFARLAEDYGAVRELIAARLAQSRVKGPEEPGHGFRGELFGLGHSHFERLRGTYNSLIHVPRGPAAGGGPGSLGGGSSHPTGFKRALNPNLDWRAIENEYLSMETPVLWFDGFLSPEALEGVLDYCREATVFFDIKLGYLGAYANDGLTSPWLVQIAHELQERLPRVLEGMTLSNMWAYKFDSDTSMDGISVHADSASVNLNFWVTPDEANLDPSSGGLVVYPKAPPVGGAEEGLGDKEVSMNQWNNSSQKSWIEAWLKDEGVYDLAMKVPYRQNRVVVFDSKLLHETDKFRFREGYENRRINLTFLFAPAEEAPDERRQHLRRDCNKWQKQPDM